MSKIVNSVKNKLKSHPFLRKIFQHLYIGPGLNILNNSHRHVLFNSKFEKNINSMIVDYSLESTKKYIDNSINWLQHNQKQQKDNGISCFIYWNFGKTVLGGSYPEVNGYIIPTLISYSDKFNDVTSFESAIKLGDFLLTQQNPDGSFPGGAIGWLEGPRVFNSAQIVHGLIELYKKTKENKYLQSLDKCCEWMVSIQESDGSWGKNNYREIKRTYDSKVSQALLEASELGNRDKYALSAQKNLDFVLRNQISNGWFRNADNSVHRNKEPLTHTIGYTIQGLIEAYKITSDKRYLASARRPLSKLLHIFEVSHEPLKGRFDKNWKSTVSSICVTGCAQISICWLEYYLITKDNRYLNAALKMNDALKLLQIKSTDLLISGSLPASAPFWGDYGTYQINSWGVKYAIDSWLLEFDIKNNLVKNK